MSLSPLGSEPSLSLLVFSLNPSINPSGESNPFLYQNPSRSECLAQSFDMQCDQRAFLCNAMTFFTPQMCPIARKLHV